MRYGLSLLFALLAASPALPQTSPAAPARKNTKPVAAKAVSNKTVSKKAVTKSPAAAKKGTSSKKTVASKKGKSSRKPVAAAVARQMTPTPERYKEIQQALVEKGYLKSEPKGVWDAQSSDALRQFQTDQKLSPTGKLSSASLIALGLGPKTAGGPVGGAPVQTPVPAEPAATPVPTPEN
jgi:putative peptidoglycan binding protein